MKGRAFAALTALALCSLAFPAASEKPLKPKLAAGAERETKAETAFEKSTVKKKYIGKFTVTAYCSCPICCGKWAKRRTKGVITASGKKAAEGVTVAAPWNVLPKGTVIEINKVGRRVVQDKLARWVERKYKGRIIDVYFDNHAAAKKFGRQLKDVWLVKDGSAPDTARRLKRKAR